MELLFAHKAELEITVFLLLAAAAWRWGAGPERAAAASMFVMLIMDPIYHWVIGRDALYSTVELGHLAQDCVVAGLLLAIAMRANRSYTLWLAAFQLLAVLSHVSRSLSPSSAPLAYSVLAYLPSYLLTFTLGIGLLIHVRRRLRCGPYRSWWNDCPPWRLAGNTFRR